MTNLKARSTLIKFITIGRQLSVSWLIWHKRDNSSDSEMWKHRQVSAVELEQRRVKVNFRGQWKFLVGVWNKLFCCTAEQWNNYLSISYSVRPTPSCVGNWEEKRFSSFAGVGYLWILQYDENNLLDLLVKN